MDDAASPYRPPRGSGGQVSRLLVLTAAGVLTVLILVLALAGEPDSGPSASSEPAERETPVVTATLPPPEAFALLPEPVDVEPLGMPLTDSLALRRSFSTLALWDEPPPADGPRASCTLIVVDDRDRPVPGARVEVWGEEGEPEKVSIGEGGYRITGRAAPIGPIAYVTDADGRCVVHPPQHTPSLIVEKAGVGCSGWVDLDRMTRVRELLVPLQRAARVRGLVLAADGTPVAGAKAALRTTCAPGAPHRVPDEVVADAGGRFELDVDGAGLYWFTASDGAVTGEACGLEVRSGAQHEIVLRLPASWSLSGALFRPPGSPELSLAGRSIKLWPDAGAGPGDRLREKSRTYRARTTEAGEFEIAIDRPLKGRVTASVDGWALADLPTVIVDAAHPHAEVVLRLCEPAWIAGRIVDAAGRSLAGALVTASPTERSVHWDVIRVPDEVSDAGSAKASSDADGRFRLGPLHPQGVYDLWGRVSTDEKPVDPYHAASLARRAVPAGTSDLRLAVGGEDDLDASISLLVVSGADGTLVPDFSVHVSTRTHDGGWSNPWFQPWRDASGLFVADGMRAGASCCLTVEAKGLGTATLSGVEPTAEGTCLRVVLPKLAQADVGVTDSGAPAPWAIVAWRRRLEGCNEAMGSKREGSRRADGTGHASFASMDPGHYTFSVTHGDHTARRDVDIAPGESASLDFDLR